MERIFDSPRRVRFVAANVAASDTVKGSHIQRNPLSMGALAEPEEWPRVSQSPKEKKRRDCVMTARLTLSGMQQRKLAHSCEVGSYFSKVLPFGSFRDIIMHKITDISKYVTHITPYKLHCEAT